MPLLSTLYSPMTKEIRIKLDSLSPEVVTDLQERAKLYNMTVNNTVKVLLSDYYLMRKSKAIMASPAIGGQAMNPNEAIQAYYSETNSEAVVEIDVKQPQITTKQPEIPPGSHVSTNSQQVVDVDANLPQNDENQPEIPLNDQVSTNSDQEVEEEEGYGLDDLGL